MLIFALKSLNTIATGKLHIDQLQIHFKDIRTFGTKEIIQFYEGFEPKVKATTVNWRIYTLVQSGMLSRKGRGEFTLGESRIFIPQLTQRIKTLYRKINKQFPYLQICVWNTSILNELMIHQPGRFYTLIEVEKDSMESVFYFLKETYKNIFLDPSVDILSHYVSGEKETIIVKSLVSQAPTQMLQGIETVTLEKILVDILTDDVLFAAQQGSEMQTIFKEAFEKYSVHESRMLRYADRKRKKEALINYLNRISKHEQVKSSKQSSSRNI